jgi:hypothetical protein
MLFTDHFGILLQHLTRHQLFLCGKVGWWIIVVKIDSCLYILVILRFTSFSSATWAKVCLNLCGDMLLFEPIIRTPSSSFVNTVFS